MLCQRGWPFSWSPSHLDPSPHRPSTVTFAVHACQCTPTSDCDAVELTITQREPTRTESQTSTQSRDEGDDIFGEQPSRANAGRLINISIPNKHLKIFYYNVRSYIP